MDNARVISKIAKLEEKKKSDKIVKFLGSGDGEVVSAALIALGKIKDETSANSISAFIDHSNIDIRKAAITAIGMIGTEYSKTLLQHRLTTEKDEDIKKLILDTIHIINANK